MLLLIEFEKFWHKSSAHFPRPQSPLADDVCLRKTHRPPRKKRIESHIIFYNHVFIFFFLKLLKKTQRLWCQLECPCWVLCVALRGERPLSNVYEWLVKLHLSSMKEEKKTTRIDKATFRWWRGNTGWAEERPFEGRGNRWRRQQRRLWCGQWLGFCLCQEDVTRYNGENG